MMSAFHKLGQAAAVLVAGWFPQNQTFAGSSQLIIDVSGLAPEKTGTVNLSLDSSRAAFLSRELPLRTAKVAAAGESVRIVVAAIPAGEYAIKVFHDVNGDGELATNFLGIPVEPYGISNDARGLFGLPDYKEAAFNFDGSEKTIAIHMAPHI
jgi:uncharacterized protein (DUF2141 family)